MAKSVSILDVTSNKMYFAVGNKTTGGMYNIDYFAEREFEGYYEGQMSSPDTLVNDIYNLLSMTEMNKLTKEIYVSIPTDFIRIEKNNYLMNFGREKYISEATINELHDKANIFNDSNEWKVISSAASKYILDEKDYTLEPIGERAETLRGDISFILAKTDYLDLFESALSKIGYKNVNFVSSSWAISNRYINEDERIRNAAYVNIGFASSSLSIVNGDGLDRVEISKSGRANMAYDLSCAANIYFEEALELLNQVNLYIPNNEESIYSVETDSGVKSYQSSKINNFVKIKIKEIADFINYILSQNSTIKEDSGVYISGDGLDLIKGAFQYLEQQLKRKLRMLIVDIKDYDKPQYTNMLALLDYAYENMESKSFWNRIF